MWVYTYMWSEVAQSCPTLWNPMDCSLPGFSVHGIFQARVLEWGAIAFSRGSSWPMDQTWVSCTVGRCFTLHTYTYTDRYRQTHISYYIWQKNIPVETSSITLSFPFCFWTNKTRRDILEWNHQDIPVGAGPGHTIQYKPELAPTLRYPAFWVMGMLILSVCKQGLEHLIYDWNRALDVWTIKSKLRQTEFYNSKHWFEWGDTILKVVRNAQLTENKGKLWGFFCLFVCFL